MRHVHVSQMPDFNNKIWEAHENSVMRTWYLNYSRWRDLSGPPAGLDQYSLVVVTVSYQPRPPFQRETLYAGSYHRIKLFECTVLKIGSTKWRKDNLARVAYKYADFYVPRRCGPSCAWIRKPSMRSTTPSRACFNT